MIALYHKVLRAYITQSSAELVIEIDLCEIAKSQDTVNLKIHGELVLGYLWMPNPTSTLDFSVKCSSSASMYFK